MPATLVALAATVAALLVPPYSLVVLALAAVAGAAALDPAELYGRLRRRRNDAASAGFSSQKAEPGGA